MRRVIVGLAACVVLVSCSPSGNPAKAAVKSPKERRPAPDFSLKDSDGKTVNLSDFKGKVVLLNFWATWCGPCRVEIPWFIEFEKTHKDRGFAVIGVSMDEDGWASVKPYIDEHKMNYRVLVGSDEVARKYGGVDSLPTTFLIDREGNIAATHVGLVGKKEYLNDILQLLDGEAAGRSALARVAAFALGAR